ncbi:MAG TPA: ribonuclease HI family protein [Myxococcales bacterium]|nr:ribonuclease HI family protein [Myxococcales bacterium]
MPASPAQLLLALAEHDTLESACAALGIGKDDARRLLRGAAKQLAAPGDPEPKHGAHAASRSVHTTSPGQVRRVLVFSDGAARGNPGPAGAGAVVLDENGHVLRKLGRFLGKQTNNVAEYEGLLLGLRWARAHGAREVEVRADSQLLIRQLQGSYAVKNEVLRRLHSEALALLRAFEKYELVHVPREQNSLADEMSNRAINEELNDA